MDWCVVFRRRTEDDFFFLSFSFFLTRFVAVVAAVALVSELLLASPRGRWFVSQDRRLPHVVEEIFVPYPRRVYKHESGSDSGLA